jgi:hypothetical protein
MSGTRCETLTPETKIIIADMTLFNKSLLIYTFTRRLSATITVEVPARTQFVNSESHRPQLKVPSNVNRELK